MAKSSQIVVPMAGRGDRFALLSFRTGVAIALFAGLFPVVSEARFCPYRELGREGRLQRRRIKENNFEVERDLEQYVRLLGKAFSKAVRSLDENDEWLDSGGGQGTALIDYAEKGFIEVPLSPKSQTYRKSLAEYYGAMKEQGQRFGEKAIGVMRPFSEPTRRIYLRRGKPAKLTLYTYVLEERGNQHEIELYEKTGDLEKLREVSSKYRLKANGVKLITGHFIEDPQFDLGIGKYRLITDAFASSAYTPDIPLVLRKYARALKAGGKLIFSLDPSTFLISKGRVPVSPREWLSRLKGLDLASLTVVKDKKGNELWQVEMTRTTARYSAPRLKLASFKAASSSEEEVFPPRREYVLERGW